LLLRERDACKWQKTATKIVGLPLPLARNILKPPGGRMTTPGRYIDPAINFENRQPRRGQNALDKPFSTGADPYQLTMDIGLIHALWRRFDPQTIDSIEADPVAFSDRVAAYRHNLHCQAGVEV
jgi:hypothetical protein